MEKLLKKLKSERGATGTDVLISATLIVLSIVIVSMLYVNTSLESRNITRTAGATRIATNIIENINAISYDEFLTTFATYTGSDTETILQLIGNGNSVFGTKIPTGFTVDINANPVYGSTTNTSKQFDLVRKIEIIVKYDVGNVEEQVNFSTVKQRELIEDCNEPDLNNLRASGILKAGMNYYPIKYVQSAKAYVKTTESDPEWYNYQNRYWAMVIVSKVGESNLFDSNGKFIGQINTDTASSTYTEKMIWVPRFFANKDTANKNIQFAFKANESQMISNAELTAQDGTSKFNYYTFSSVNSAIWNVDSSTSLFSLTTGLWVVLDEITENAASDALNKSQYGPCIVH